MQPTNTKDPQYYHKVVDCQWGCPAHTDVPGYIRHIAQGEYTQAYLLNRESNVFPGILGRVCDRPCEPVCRRVRVEEEPVAICRLKRVAGDLKGSERERHRRNRCPYGGHSGTERSRYSGVLSTAGQFAKEPPLSPVVS